jgi:hypothetical protein
MKVLNVAEKPSMARQITEILSRGEFDSVYVFDPHLFLDQWKKQVL